MVVVLYLIGEGVVVVEKVGQGYGGGVYIVVGYCIVVEVVVVFVDQLYGIGEVVVYQVVFKVNVVVEVNDVVVVGIVKVGIMGGQLFYRIYIDVKYGIFDCGIVYCIVFGVLFDDDVLLLIGFFCKVFFQVVVLYDDGVFCCVFKMNLFIVQGIDNVIIKGIEEVILSNVVMYINLCIGSYFQCIVVDQNLFVNDIGFRVVLYDGLVVVGEQCWYILVEVVGEVVGVLFLGFQEDVVVFFVGFEYYLVFDDKRVDGEWGVGVDGYFYKDINIVISLDFYLFYLVVCGVVDVYMEFVVFVVGQSYCVNQYRIVVVVIDFKEMCSGVQFCENGIKVQGI